jgi:hypothetical protein
VPFLGERLRPVPHVSPERLARLVADLDADDLAARQKAARELEGLDEMAVPALRKAQAERPPLEMRRRIEALLEKLEAPMPPSGRLRVIRAARVLEQAGTPEARRVLEALARGAPEAPLTREAKASLERLGRLHPRPRPG